MKKLLFLLVIASLLVLPATAMAKKQPTGTVWTVPTDFGTIQEAIYSDDVLDGDVILVDGALGPYFDGAYVTKDVEIRGLEGAVINGGPAHSSGLIMGFRLLAGSDGATISHLQFEVDLAIMNGDAVNDVTVTQCTMLEPIQGVSNWRGSGWTITDNEIFDLRTRDGGGIGILIGDYNATEGGVNGNLVSRNTISGTLLVDPEDGGGYAGSGIVLFADFRWGGPGALEMAYNRVLHNQIGLVSDTPTVVDVWAIELTQGYYPDDPPEDPELVICGNDIAFNDLRGSTNQIALTPEELADCNTFLRNVGARPGPQPGPLGDAFGPGE